MLNKIGNKLGTIIGYTLVCMAALIALGLILIVLGFVWRGMVSVWSF